jgi:hypothetical protein
MSDQTRLTLLDRTVFETFVHPGEVVEVRILGASGKSSAWGNEAALRAINKFL